MKYEQFIEREFSPTNLSVLFEKSVTPDQYGWISEQLFDLNSSIGLRPMVNEKNEINQIILVYILAVIFLFLFVVVNIIMLFRYWLMRGSDLFKVYRICGASNLFVYFLIVAHALGLTILSFLIGSATFVWTASLFYKTVPLDKLLYTSVALFLLLWLVIILTIHRDAIKIASSKTIYQ